jgi:hypothetical protein
MNMFETCQYYLGQIIGQNVQNGTMFLANLVRQGLEDSASDRPSLKKPMRSKRTLDTTQLQRS